MICKHIFDDIVKQASANYLHSFKWFQVLLCITNNSIKYQPFAYA